MKKPLEILFFANIPIPNEERSIGGATVLAKKILDEISLDKRISVTHIQIRTFWRNKLQLIDYFLWLFRFPFVVRRFDLISFHGTKDFHFTIAPILWLWARLLKKKTSYHFFGGNFHEQFRAFPKFYRKFLKKTILNSDTVLFETLEMIDFFKIEGVLNSVWLPNSREPIIGVVPRKNYSKKFVFISRVIPQKGIEEILETVKILPEDYTVDIYGPIDDRHYSTRLFDGSKANYMGLLPPSEVINTLSTYDVLLLPSYFEGEGYPGIVIEALSLAIPVITTKWKALPEIITDNQNGVLIDIKNCAQLEKAILSFNSDNYMIFSKNALNSFDNFNSKLVFNKVVERFLI